MNIYILYDKSGIYSGRSLGSNLIRELYGKADVHRGRPFRLEHLLKRGGRYDYIINIGWFKPFHSGGAKVLNPPENILRSSNKRAARINFKEHNIQAPKLWLNYNDISEANYPVIGRTTHHAKGRGLWYCKNRNEAAAAHQGGATHFLKFIPNTREFRVHVMANAPELKDKEPNDYKTIKLSEKLPRNEGAYSDIVKNHDNNWVFGYPDKDDPVLPSVRSISKKAIAQFGLHWGAVDVMVSRDTGQPFVLEINSTPCLTDDSADTLYKYSTAICELVGIYPQRVRKVSANKSLAAAPISSKPGVLKALLKRNNF